MLVSGVRSSWRGVGDELALALDRALGLGPGGVELAQHLVEGAGELGDLVVALRLGDPAGGVAGGGDVAGRRGQRGDRPHRAVGDRHPGEAGEQRADRDAAAEEEPEPADRLADGGLRAARTGRRAAPGSGPPPESCRRGRPRREATSRPSDPDDLARVRAARSRSGSCGS